jgi:iron complex outermembrane receptor protein
MDQGTTRRRSAQGGVSTLLMLFIACFCCSFARADALPALPPTLHFDIPAGDAQKTLLQFLTQSSIEMLYSSEDVRGVTTHAVSGDLSVAQALHQMLDGTGLEISFENDFTFASIKPAKNLETGPATPPSLATAMTTRDFFRGRPDIPLQALGDEQKLEEVVVTGTLMHGVVDIVSPLQFVTRNEMNRTSYATVQDALQALTLSSGGGPSDDFSGVGNFGRGVSANLRGLGSGATLILIDGRRQPFSGTQGDFVDVSNIPWSAVDRIEVLPDGASALYGSDAVAGVINIIMRKDLSGGETWARMGASVGGADEKLVAQTFGTNWQSGHALLSYQYWDRTSLAASARAYAADSDKTAFGGTDFRSFRSSPGNILDPRTLQPAFAIPTGQDGTSLTVSDLLPGSVNLQNRYSTNELLPDREMHSAFFSGSQSLGERVELFAQARYSKRNVSQQLFAYDQILPVPTSNPFVVNPYPTSPVVMVGYNFLNDLGPIAVSARTQTLGTTLGLNAQLSDSWRLKLSGSYGQENLVAATANQVNLAALAKALASTDPATAFNPFGAGGNNSPAVIDAIRVTLRDRAESNVTSGTLIADGTVLQLPSGPTKLALGTEWREEQFGNAAGGGMPFERQVQSAFAELSVPIVGEADDPHAAPRLELSLAGRYEHYSDFGSTANPKIGLRWAPTNSIKLRTSWGTSFRAPKLTDLYDSSHNTVLLASLRDPRSTTGSSLVLASQGNNPSLKQETATTWTSGVDFAFQTIPNATLSLTYYTIDYTDRIVTPGLGTPASILLQEDQWSSVVTRSPSQAAIAALCDSPYYKGVASQCKSTPIAAIIDFDWRNLAATRVKGIDLKFDESLDTRYGNLQLGLNGGYTLSFEQAVSDTSRRVDISDTVGNPLALRLRGSVEWYQHRWDLPGFGASATVDHSGSYRDVNVGAERAVNAFTSLDLRFSYRSANDGGLLSDTEISLNATNVFDRAPPFVDREDGYDILNADPYGRVVSLSLQKKW